MSASTLFWKVWLSLPFVSAMGLTAALLLAYLGVFIRLNRSAEALEPEGMEQAKEEYKRIKK